MDKGYSEQIRTHIDKLLSGDTVTANSFKGIPRATVIQILNRLAKIGIITRVKRGVFSKTITTRFGVGKATPLEVLAREVNNDDGKCFGGLFLFNQLGLTTQVPTIIEILNNKSSYQLKVGSTSVRYVRIRPIIKKVTKGHIITLEIIKKIKRIPDSSIKDTYKWLRKRIKSLEEKELNRLVTIAKEYPPRVRAILGNMLEEMDLSLAGRIKKELIETSFYSVGEIVDHLKNPRNWGLKK